MLASVFAFVQPSQGGSVMAVGPSNPIPSNPTTDAPKPDTRQPDAPQPDT